ncbi:MAG TPA: chaperone modulator CbpM [Steroidobacteraceae bacterium]|nr:chaperone modulator CbpM [Steroidobacteraceae bacterium]
MISPTLKIDAELLDDTACVSANELCRLCHADLASLIEMVEWGLLEAEGSRPEEWRFGARALRRAQTAFRLQSDLGVNLAGAAVIVELLDERGALARRLAQLEVLVQDD